MTAYTFSVLTNISLISFLALSAYLILLAGQVSFGQQAFFGLGAYCVAIFLEIFQFNIFISIISSLVLVGFFGCVFSILTIRLNGIYFSVASLAFAEIFRLGATQIRFSVDINGKKIGPDGPEGFRNIRWIFDSNISVEGFFLLSFSLLLLCIFLLIFLEKSKFLKSIRLVGQDKILAISMGVSPAKYRILAVSLGCIVGGLGGALFALNNTYIEPEMFGLMLGVHGLAYSIIGGLGSPIGPIAGVLIDVGVLDSVWFLSSFRMIIFGGLVALILILFPSGLISLKLVNRIRNMQKNKDA